MKKHYLDITKEHCPMTFVKTRLKLEEMQEEDELEILLSEGEPLENVPKAAEETGCRILSQEKSGGSYLVKIRKETAY